MSADRRKRQRTPGTPAYPKKLREHLIDAAKAGAHEALEEFHRSRAAHFNGMSPEDHIKDHHYVKPRREIWEWLKLTAGEGAGAGLKRIVAVLVTIMGVTAILSMFGAVMSPAVRQWIVTLLGG